MSAALMLSSANPTHVAYVIEHLPAAARRDFDFWRAIVEPVLGQQRGAEAALARACAEAGVPHKTALKRFYRARRQGLLGLVNRALCGPEFWQRSKSGAVTVKNCEPLKELFRRLCEESDRSCVTAHKELLKMWRRRDPEIGAIPEYRDFPGWPALPAGWSYDNLMIHAPTEYELAAARVGRFASSMLRPTVFTTRVGLWVGSHYMFDDKWHDYFVNSFSARQAGRPLEIYSLDVFTACKRRWGARIRERNVEGNYTGIAEVMMRYVLAATLHLDGYSPRGTIIVAEKGTAKVREELAKILSDKTGGLVTVSEGGMTGDPAHLGQYPGLVRGNFRHKAALESNNNLEHNRFDRLPGQTGRNVAERPEELVGRLDYNSRLLAAAEKLPPEKAALLEHPLLELNEWLDVANHIYAEIARDRDHALEGWIEAGHTMQMIQLGGQEIPLCDLTPEQREKLPALLDAGLVTARPARMSRLEAWNRGARDLIKLPGWGVVAILGDDLAREVAVRDNMIEVQDLEIGPSPFRFEPFITTADGETRQLRDGEKFQAFINPFAPDTLFVRDLRGAYLGEAARIFAPSRADHEGVRRAIGAAMKRETALLGPMRSRHAKSAADRLQRHRRNADVIASVPREAAKAESTRQKDATALLLARSGPDDDSDA